MSDEVPSAHGPLPDGAAGDAAALPRTPSSTTTPAVPHPPPAIPDHELIRRIGAGAYGEVWLACNALGAYRAVKVVYRSDFDSDRPYEREFEGIRKSEPVSRTHDSQVDILHVGRGDGYFFYVMELADDAGGQRSGGVLEAWSNGPSAPTQLPITPSLHYPASYSPRTLKHDLQTRGRLPPAECVEIGLALATALAHLHGHGLVHRDVKPSNIIFVGGVPKLADIGLVTDSDTTFSYVGTEGYVAPEGPGSPQADLYSLGKVLYEISTGKDRKEYPALPPELRSLPDSGQLVELNTVLLKACARDPRERYASADALRADLELLQRGRSVRRKRARQRRWALVRTAGVAGGALAMLALFGSLLFSTLTHRMRTIPVAEADRISIFVLPFRNPTPYLHRPTTEETANEICARMTDALIDSLAAIDGVRVGPRKSAWIFEPEETLRARVAQAPFLMSHVVCGRLEITNAILSGRVELYETRQERLLWSTDIVGTTNEVIALEKSILSGLVSTLRLSVKAEAQVRIDRILASNWAAYLKYVEGLYQHGLLSTPGLTPAMEAFNQALELDPQYLDARLGVVMTRRVLTEWAEPPRRIWPDTRSDLRDILAIDDTCYRARYWLASLQISYDYDWEQGMAGYEQLIRLNPADHLAWALYYRWLGRAEAAQIEQDKAEQAYPSDGFVLDHASGARYVAREYRPCVRQAEHARSLRPRDHNPLFWVARASIELGDFSKALKALREYRKVEDAPEIMALEGRACALMGQRERAREILGQLDTKMRYVSPYSVAWVHAALGEKAEALAALERAYDDHSERLVNSDFGSLRTDPAWDNLRDDPRFEKLCQRVGLGKGQWPRK